MANLDELKKKAKDALSTIADVSVEAYKVAEEKAKVVARRARLNAEIAREKALIRRRFSDIGKVYYEQRKDAPDEEHKQHCDDITAAYGNIETKKAEIEELKNKTAPAVTEDDFEPDTTAQDKPADKDKSDW